MSTTPWRLHRTISHNYRVWISSGFHWWENKRVNHCANRTPSLIMLWFSANYLQVFFQITEIIKMCSHVICYIVCKICIVVTYNLLCLCLVATYNLLCLCFAMDCTSSFHGMFFSEILNYKFWKTSKNCPSDYVLLYCSTNIVCLYCWFVCNIVSCT